MVDDVIEEWLERHPETRRPYELLVLHTHSHDDHVAGDTQFADRPGTTLVPADKEIAWEYFGFTEDVHATGTINLGDRTLDVLATPGHHASAVTYYDPWTGILFTGDTVYRGRLYIVDWQAFARSIDRLIEFSESHRVSHVIGCHIEMTRAPGVDYPVLTTYQPDEPVLEMSVEHLYAVRAALETAGPAGAPRLRRLHPVARR